MADTLVQVALGIGLLALIMLQAAIALNSTAWQWSQPLTIVGSGCCVVFAILCGVVTVILGLAVF